MDFKNRMSLFQAVDRSGAIECILRLRHGQAFTTGRSWGHGAQPRNPKQRFHQLFLAGKSTSALQINVNWDSS